MPVLLYSAPPAIMPADAKSYCWAGPHEDLNCGIAATENLALRLEAAFTGIYEQWRRIALTLQTQPSSELAHMPTMSTYASDFGVMLAWVKIVKELGAAPETTMVFCSDPWLFRALATLSKVTPVKAPSIRLKQLKLSIRGFIARSWVALRMISARFRLGAQKSQAPESANWILVYGHPNSTSDGYDAYFGNLMHDIPSLQRIMHTDCGFHRAEVLCRDSRSFSLHAWGRYCTAAKLPFAKWRPDVAMFDNAIASLVRRAAAIEGSGGSAAMTKWQMSCQASWLDTTRPQNVNWPWENHPWERHFSRRARSIGTKTGGYQHTVVGRHMYNQGADANADNLKSLPDKIILNGPAYRRDLVSRGVPENQCVEAGSHRIGGKNLPIYANDGPVFLALSNNPSFARQMIEAARPLANAQTPFLVKDHPLSPYPVDESAYFEHTRLPLDQLPPLRALIYCTGTTGLEGFIAGIPTLRFIPNGGVALDILPPQMQVMSASAYELATALKNLPDPGNQNETSLFPPPNIKIWRELLETETSKIGSLIDEK